MTYYYDTPPADFEFEKDIEIDIDFDFDPSVDVDVYKETDIDINIDTYANVEGNTAEVLFDVEAVGYDTYTQLDLVVLTVENELSSITGYAVSSVG